MIINMAKSAVFTFRVKRCLNLLRVNTVDKSQEFGPI